MQDDIIKEFREETRKLKAMIVKHENRIRALEAKMIEMEGNDSMCSGPAQLPVPMLSAGMTNAPSPSPDNKNAPDDLAPDEV